MNAGYSEKGRCLEITALINCRDMSRFAPLKRLKSRDVLQLMQFWALLMHSQHSPKKCLVRVCCRNLAVFTHCDELYGFEVRALNEIIWRTSAIHFNYCIALENSRFHFGIPTKQFIRFQPFSPDNKFIGHCRTHVQCYVTLLWETLCLFVSYSIACRWLKNVSRWSCCQRSTCGETIIFFTER